MTAHWVIIKNNQPMKAEVKSGFCRFVEQINNHPNMRFVCWGK